MKRFFVFGIALILVVPMAPGAQSANSAALNIEGADRSVQPGDVLRVTLVGPAGLDGVVGTVFSQRVRFYGRPGGTTWEGLIGVDLDAKPGSYPLTVSATRAGHPAAVASQELRVVPKQFPTRRLRVANQFVEPPPGELDRIQREATRLAASFVSITPRHWEGPFATPIASTPSSNFGSRSIYNGQKRSPHAGVDFGGDSGTPVASPNAGVVVLAEDLFFTGNTVVVDHGLGLFSLFAHLSRVDVTAAQPVAKGAVLGLLGGTGRVTGPHLHWAVRLNGARVDPMSLVAALESP